ncbi:MAG: hypothetical protein HC897_08190 [Thermoanaerobaculia bacterium]|nr:hypothetical protein [Thermoanaerobaculia bacterium]
MSSKNHALMAARSQPPLACLRKLVGSIFDPLAQKPQAVGTGSLGLDLDEHSKSQ